MQIINNFRADEDDEEYVRGAAVQKQNQILTGTDVLNTEIRAHEVRVEESFTPIEVAIEDEE